MSRMQDMSTLLPCARQQFTLFKLLNRGRVLAELQQHCIDKISEACLMYRAASVQREHMDDIAVQIQNVAAKTVRFGGWEGQGSGHCGSVLLDSLIARLVEQWFLLRQSERQVQTQWDSMDVHIRLILKHTTRASIRPLPLL
jgi:hypothetical protein